MDVAVVVQIRAVDDFRGGAGGGGSSGGGSSGVMQDKGGVCGGRFAPQAVQAPVHPQP